MRACLICIITSLFLLSFAFGQTPTPSPIPENKSRDTSKPQAKSQEVKTPYMYIPTNEKFWNKMKELWEEKKYKFAIEQASKRVGDLQTNQQKEALLAVGIGLRNAGYPASAGLVLLETLKNSIGSAISELSLVHLDELYRMDMVHQAFLNDVIVATAVESTHWSNQAFIGKLRSSYALKFGLVDWYKKEVEKVVEESYWAKYYQYLTALSLITRGEVEKGYSFIGQMYEDETIVDPLKQKIGLQQARILFEKREFEKALEIYQQLKLPLREWGRSLYEQAWALYYLKRYDKALGVLQAAKTKYFSASPSLESHLLEIIIFKDLCHYKRVDLLAKDFRTFYKDAFRAIRKRQDLGGVPTLARISLLNNYLQDEANLASQVRKEKNTLKKLSNSFTQYKGLVSELGLLESEIQEALNIEVQNSARGVANELLDIEEQILFLEYTAKLDALRIAAITNEKPYASEEKPTTSFDRFYWPVDREKWLDELKDYKVLIKSKCFDKK